MKSALKSNKTTPVTVTAIAVTIVELKNKQLCYCIFDYLNAGCSLLHKTSNNTVKSFFCL